MPTRTHLSSVEIYDAVVGYAHLMRIAVEMEMPLCSQASLRSFMEIAETAGMRASQQR